MSMPSERRQSRRSSLKLDSLRFIFERHADPATGFISRAQIEKVLEASRGNQVVSLHEAQSNADLI